MIISINIFSQRTVGVIDFTEEATPGYIFFSPFNSTKAFMVDNCGHLINEWDRGTLPGLSAYFLETGQMFRTYKVDPIGPFKSASNAGGLELVDWDNNTVWSYEFNTSTWLSHHDAVMMPNGNILALTWELEFEDDLITWGRDPDEIANEGYMWSEKIIEIKPIGSNDMEIVWEWNIKDHYIQEFDSTKMFFGVVKDHPELFDINLPELNSNNSNSTRDWNHFNAIDYNEDLDQILISVRNSDEIWIIDHSTTTEEAASHTGGRYGKGGDILYRWGNASAYQRAPVSEQKLFGQHGVNWIPNGLEDEGKIIIYNNGNGRPGPDFSSIEIIDPPQTEDGHYIIPETDPIGPEVPGWSFDDDGDFYSPYFSNANRLQNGHTFINAGSAGRVFEINANGEKVWEYEIPLAFDFPIPQGLNASNNGTFRAYKYAYDYPGLQDLDLTPGSTIEINDFPFECNLTSIETLVETNVEIYFNSQSRELFIKNPDRDDLQLIMVNAYGQQMHNSNFNEDYFIEITSPSGIYFATLIENGTVVKTLKIYINSSY